MEKLYRVAGQFEMLDYLCLLRVEKYNEMIRTDIVLFLFSVCLMAGSCSRGPVENDSFDRKVMMLEENPSMVLSLVDTACLQPVRDEKSAENFLLFSLSENLLDSRAFPDKSELINCIRLFSGRKNLHPYLESMYLLAGIYSREKDLTSEVATVETALETARKTKDDVWMFYLYDYMSEMYFRQHDLISYVKYQNLAIESIGRHPELDNRIPIAVRKAKNLLYTGKHEEALEILKNVSGSIGPTHFRYASVECLLSVAYYRLELWDEAAAHMENVLRSDRNGEFTFLAYAVLSYCHHYLGDTEMSRHYKNLAAECEMSGSVSSYTEIEFHKLSAEFARERGNTENQISSLEAMVSLYENIIGDMNVQTLDAAMQEYSRMCEKNDAEFRIRLYRLALFLLVTAIFIMCFVYLNQKKNRAYEYLLLNEQIETLEKFRAIKDEAREIILNDFEIARQIALLKYTRKEKSRYVLDELEKLSVLKGNNLLCTRWDKFFYHIDISFNDFHSKLIRAYPDLNEKEIQLCCMLVAGFRTDEIAAIWMQSVYSVHKYKTGIRKKTGAPEGADIAAFLKEKLHV